MGDFQSDRRRLIGAGVLLAGGAAAACSARAQGDTSADSRWQPAAEDLDSWLDKPGTRHRMVFDTTSAEAGMGALAYATVFLHENEVAYGLKPEQVGTAIIFRHHSTPFGYNNVIWAKYGAAFAKRLELKGEIATRAARMNPVLDNPPSPLPAGLDWLAEATLSKLAAKGARFPVCGVATRNIAVDLAKAGGNADAIEAELKASLVPGAVIVPAGIVAVNRAQEHGYSFVSIG